VVALALAGLLAVGLLAVASQVVVWLVVA